MSGFMNRGETDAAPEDNGPVPTGDDLLNRIEQQIESQLTPDNRQNYLKIVTAGMAAAMEGGPNSLMASLKQSQDPVAECAKGAVALVLILRKQAHGIMPERAMVPAAMTLMLKALGFAQRMKLIPPVDAATVERATHVFTDFLLARVGISKQQLAGMAQAVDRKLQDPDAVQQMRYKAGLDRHPMAPVPTIPGVG